MLELERLNSCEKNLPVLPGGRFYTRRTAIFSEVLNIREKSEITPYAAREIAEWVAFGSNRKVRATNVRKSTSRQSGRWMDKALLNEEKFSGRMKLTSVNSRSRTETRLSFGESSRIVEWNGLESRYTNGLTPVEGYHAGSLRGCRSDGRRTGVTTEITTRKKNTKSKKTKRHRLMRCAAVAIFASAIFVASFVARWGG